MIKLGTVGVIGRFRPLHKGGALMLDRIFENAEYVKIGIGSSNKYNARCPFTAEETKEMIDAYLKPKYNNYEILMVQDFGHIPEYSDGQKWRENVKELFGKLDYFVTGNEYTANLLKDDYKIIHPATLIPPEDWIYVKGSIVRVAMAQNGDYRKMIPNVVADYLEKHDLIKRFQKEFGLETLALLDTHEWAEPENAEQEKNHIVKN
jgi:nicotinamide-nucleotide adenylyltransferase